MLQNVNTKNFSVRVTMLGFEKNRRIMIEGFREKN